MYFLGVMIDIWFSVIEVQSFIGVIEEGFLEEVRFKCFFKFL